MNRKEQLRKLQLILVMAFSIYPLILIVLKSIALGLLPFGWVIPDAGTAALLVGAGLVGGVAQIMLTAERFSGRRRNRILHGCVQ